MSDMQIVKTGKEKQYVYTKEYNRLEKALKQEFYLEAIAIEYAIIEDRLVAFFHHAGIVSRNHKNLLVNRAVSPYLRCLLGKAEGQQIGIKDITVKMDLIEKLLQMTEAQAIQIDTDVKLQMTGKKRYVAKSGYMFDLFTQIQKTLNIDLILKHLEELNSWRKDRNQLIHALLSKTVESSGETRKACAETGKIISRNFDDHLVKTFKRNNQIRKKYHIQ